jgi:hypothetical protein
MSFDVLQSSVDAATHGLAEIFASCFRKGFGDFELDEVEVTLEVSADGRVGFMGSGVGVRGVGSMKLKFVRRDFLVILRSPNASRTRVLRQAQDDSSFDKACPERSSRRGQDDTGPGRSRKIPDSLLYPFSAGRAPRRRRASRCAKPGVTADGFSVAETTA